MRTRLVRIVLIVVAAEAVAAAVFGPSGRRLRVFVDLLSVDGIVLAIGGAFLVADRPFLAARRMLARTAAPGSSGRNRWRPHGWFVMLVGAVLYGTAALLWAAQGGSHGIGG